MDTDMEALFAGLFDSEGSFDREREIVPVDPGVERWLPAYFSAREEEKVVDPTGGGNGFLGGLAVGLARGKDVVEACAWGSVAASFCIEQVGVPVLGEALDGKGREVWNGESVEERLDKYLRKVGGSSVRETESISEVFDKMELG